MNKRTIARAARLYSIAQVALMDTGGAESAEQVAVVQAAMDAAVSKLEAIGLTTADVASLDACIAVAKEGRHS